MRSPGIAAAAVADFRERARRPAYAVTLIAAVGLGYLAVPSPASQWVIANLGGYRGIYNSAYVGTVTALAGALWLMLGGFYVVRGTVARDERTGVGQVLAATPLRSAGYLTGKFLSNLLVLGSMAGALAVTALALQLARGESLAVNPVTLLLPFLLLTLPVLALTAAAALLFDNLPVLRAGLGNLAWFFVWMIASITGQGAAAPLGGLGAGAVSGSMRAAATARHLHPGRAEFSLGFTRHDHPLHAFAWPGLDVSAALVTQRITLVLVAAGLAALPAIWFGRFDPARAGARARARAGAGAGQTAAGLETAAVTGTVTGTAAVPGQPARPPRPAYRPLPGHRPVPAISRLLAGELRILVRGVSGWWWLPVAALNAAGLLVPAGVVKPAAALPALVLSGAWIWPVLIWSRLGTQRRENGLETLLGSYPAVRRQLLAEWGAGLAVTALAGAGPLLRMAVTADWPGVAGWLGGVLFIPSLALVLGAASRSPRLFQAVYLPLWYMVVNQVAAADYMGTVLVNGRPAGPPPLAVAGTGLAMLALAFAAGTARHARR